MNVWWHLTLGFVLALAYAVMGLFYCCTVILLPVGLGWLQFAKFLLAPHTSAMVSKSDLALVTGKSQGTAMKTYSLIIRILYFPFGLVASLSAIGMTVGYCITIIGIPSGLVWARSLSTIFNPVNKVCVPRSVAEEIERIKAGNTVSRYSGQQQPSGQTDAGRKDGTSSAAPSSVSPEVPMSPVRGYTIKKLEEIIASPEMYKPDLVEEARHEIEVRSKAESLKEKVAEFDDAKLQEILANTETYSDELVYAASMEKSRRVTEREIRMKEEQEAARIRAEQEEEAKRLRRLEVWKRVRPYVFVFAAAAVVAGLVLYFTSDQYQYARGSRLWEKSKLDKAAVVLAKVKNANYRNYPFAKYKLYIYNLHYQADTASAAAALKAGVEDNTGKAWAYCQDVVREYADHLENGDLQPYIPKNFAKAAALYEKSWKTDNKLKAGALYYEAHLYNEARGIFEEYSNYSVANGYLGMMYLYGQAGLEQDFDTAYDYLMSAPDDLPFVVHKGDLTLYLRKLKYSSSRFVGMDIVKKANEYYGIAAGLDPESEEYRIRKEVTDALIAAYKKGPYDATSYVNFRTIHNSRYWDSYSFKSGDVSGFYCGMVSKTRNGSIEPNGWGVFSWDNRQVEMTKYSYLKETDSYGIFIFEGYTIQVGKLKSLGQLSSGVETSPDGVRTEVNGR